MIQTCSCTRKREIDTEEERKNDEKKEREKKEKKCGNSSLVAHDTMQSGRNVVICRRLLTTSAS